MNRLRPFTVGLLLAAAPSLHGADQPGFRVTDTLRSVNGVGTVPVGLFGVHATPLTPERVADWGIESVRRIDLTPSGKPCVPGTTDVPVGIRTVVETFYDRYQPACLLTDPNWKQSLASLARAYGSKATDSVTHHIEFWNEPFLNWATRPGVNYDGRFYETNNRVEGGPMTIKGWDRPLDSLVWTQALRLVDIRSGQPHYVANGNPSVTSMKLVEGETNKVSGKPYRVARLWWGVDPTQTSYWSRKQNSEFYRWMIVPFARALKETNPAVQMVGGWGFSLRTDSWNAWDILFQPLLEDAAPWLDGFSEHHYGGDTRTVAADYEIAYAYALARHGKRLRFYNTEAGGQLDPQRPDTPAGTRFEGSTPEDIRAAFTYMVRDIVYLIAVCPDKAVARAQHSAQANPGSELAFRFLKPLRGRLVCTVSAAPDLWCVSSLNGKSLCVIAFNDRAAAAACPLAIEAPPGTRFTAGRVIRLETGGTKPALQTQDLPAPGTPWQTRAELPPKSALEWVFDLDQAPAALPVLNETQFVADALAYRIAVGQTTERRIVIPADALSRAKEIKLKVVYDREAPGVQFNGEPQTLPAPATAVSEIGLDLAKVRTTNSVTLTGIAPSTVAAASLVLVTP